MKTDSEVENWVKLRCECSPLEMYLKLKNGAEQDVKARMECLDLDQKVTFRLDSHENFFNVMREGRIGGATWIQFNLTKDSITVENAKGAILLRAHLTLTDQAECKLKLPNGEELDPWQFRKRALEELFFNI